MPRPEGYRKALRLMKLAERFKLPLLTFIDTPGAYPGVGAEERGQSEAIARNLMEMAELKVPIICTVIGEGGSGGALAIGVGDRTLMLEYGTYSVISPEGCASILWKTADKAKDAAEQLGLTAKRLHRTRAWSTRSCASRSAARTAIPRQMATRLKAVLLNELDALEQLPVERAAAAALRAPARLRRLRSRLSAALSSTEAPADPALFHCGRSRSERPEEIHQRATVLGTHRLETLLRRRALPTVPEHRFLECGGATVMQVADVRIDCRCQAQTP